MIPFIRKLGYDIPKMDFSVPGVTSISADCHKYDHIHDAMIQCSMSISSVSNKCFAIIFSPINIRYHDVHHMIHCKFAAFT